VRHSGATQILIELEVVEQKLKLAVTDNGRGFVPTDCRTGSDGITGMKERMSKLSGCCEINSQPGTGTSVVFWLPLGGDAS
jgi:signal transduction histidine kinase